MALTSHLQHLEYHYRLMYNVLKDNGRKVAGDKFIIQMVFAEYMRIIKWI